MKNRFVLPATLIVCLFAIFFGAICAQIAANQERIPLRDPFRQPHWKTANGNANNRGLDISAGNILFSIIKGPFYGQPEQVHLSYGGSN